MLRFSVQNPSKSFKNPIPGGIKISIDFFFDFLWILVSFWGPCGSHVGYQSAPRTPQDAAGTPPRRSKTLPGRSKTPPKRPRTALRQPKRPQEAPGRLHDQILVHFGERNGEKLAPKSHLGQISCENNLKAQNYYFRNTRSPFHVFDVTKQSP